MAKIKTVDSFDESKPGTQTVHFTGIETPQVFHLEDLCDTPEFFDEIVERAPMIARLAWHGNRRKTCDAHANAGAENWTPEQCWQSTVDVWENLVNRIWEDRETGGWLVTAIAELTGREPADCAALVKSWDDAERKKWMKDPAVVKWKTDRDAERAAKRAEKEESQIDGLFETETE